MQLDFSYPFPRLALTTSAQLFSLFAAFTLVRADVVGVNVRAGVGRMYELGWTFKTSVLSWIRLRTDFQALHRRCC